MDQFEQSIGQGRNIPLRNEQAVLTVPDDIFRPAFAREADAGDAEGFRFQQDHRKPLVSGRKGENRGILIDGRHIAFNLAEENTILKTKLGNLRFQLRPGFPVASAIS